MDEVLQVDCWLDTLFSEVLYAIKIKDVHTSNIALKSTYGILTRERTSMPVS